ncbi:hypothetical protein quinque_013589 [Culex quinquefasciatus]
MDHLLANLKNRLEIVPDSETSKNLVDRLVALGPQEEPLHLIELDNLIKQHYAWLRHLPRVNPFYAIKSNDEPTIVATSVLLGIGYDCASKSELKRVFAYGVNSEKIIFTQPAKTIEALKFARESKVRTVFDSEFELKKIQQYYPEAESCVVGQKQLWVLKADGNLLIVMRKAGSIMLLNCKIIVLKAKIYCWMENYVAEG